MVPWFGSVRLRVAALVPGTVTVAPVSNVSAPLPPIVPPLQVNIAPEVDREAATIANSAAAHTNTRIPIFMEWSRPVDL
jgi:hypothetical protein